MSHVKRKLSHHLLTSKSTPWTETQGRYLYSRNGAVSEILFTLLSKPEAFLPSPIIKKANLDNEVAQERLAIFKLFANRADRIALRWLLGVGSNDFRAKSYARLRAHCEQTGQSPWNALVALSEWRE